MDIRVFPLLNCYHYIVVSKWFINDKVCRAGGILPLSYSKFVLSSWSDHFITIRLLKFLPYLVLRGYFFNSLGILRKETC